MRRTRPPLTALVILAWADDHKARTGEWPKILTTDAGSLPPGKSWHAIDQALRQGWGGLPGGDSLPQLLARARNAPSHRGRHRPPLSEARILHWAGLHHRRTGQWPCCSSGPVADAAGEDWSNIHEALKKGMRGLPGGESLRGLLARRLGVHGGAIPRLSEETILQWAEAHHAATGVWPTSESGPVAAAPGEHWRAIQSALRLGLRGLPGGETLVRLLVRHGRLPGLWVRQRPATVAG
jgi:hypothetical protein